MLVVIPEALPTPLLVHIYPQFYSHLWKQEKGFQEERETFERVVPQNSVRPGIRVWSIKEKSIGNRVAQENRPALGTWGILYTWPFPPLVILSLNSSFDFFCVSLNVLMFRNRLECKMSGIWEFPPCWWLKVLLNQKSSRLHFPGTGQCCHNRHICA